MMFSGTGVSITFVCISTINDKQNNIVTKLIKLITTPLLNNKMKTKVKL